MYLTSLFQLQSLEVKSPTLALLFLLYFSPLDWLLRWWPRRVTCGAPGSPLSWPYAGPGRSSTQRSGRHLARTKGAILVRSPLRSPAKRTGSTLGPLGFIYPFFLARQRVDWGVKFVRCLSCDRLTTSHTLTRPFSFPKSSTLHSSDSRCRFSYSPFATEALCLGEIRGRDEAASAPTFSKEASHVNAASQAREWLKLKGRRSSFNPPRWEFQCCWRWWAPLA